MSRLLGTGRRDSGQDLGNVPYLEMLGGHQVDMHQLLGLIPGKGKGSGWQSQET